jgi:hypothetical protein
VRRAEDVAPLGGAGRPALTGGLANGFANSTPGWFWTCPERRTSMSRVAVNWWTALGGPNLPRKT